MIESSRDGQSLGVLLSQMRHRAGLSQEELAARAQVSDRTIRNLEAGRVLVPRVDAIRMLLKALDVSESECAGVSAAIERDRRRR